jgi:hypothetical protein
MKESRLRFYPLGRICGLDWYLARVIDDSSNYYDDSGNYHVEPGNYYVTKSVDSCFLPTLYFELNDLHGSLKHYLVYPPELYATE